MSKKKPLITDEDRDLDMFVKLEAKYHREESYKTSQPDLSITLSSESDEDTSKTDTSLSTESTDKGNDHSNIYQDLHKRLQNIEKREAELIKDEEWVQNQRKELKEMRKQIEKEKQDALSELEEMAQDYNYAILKKRYDNLKEAYENEKMARIKDREIFEEKLRALSSCQSDSMLQLSPANKSMFLSPPLSPSISNMKNETEASRKKNLPRVSFDMSRNVLDNSYDFRSPTPPQSPKVVSMYFSNLEKSEEDIDEIPAKVIKRKIKKGQRRISIPDLYPLDFDYDPGVVFKIDNLIDGRRNVRFKDGAQGTIYKNGTKKIKYASKVYIFFANGDVSIEYPDGAIAYRYYDSMTTELTVPDGDIYYIFKNGQKEKHLKSGEKRILFPNKQYKIIYPNGDYESYYPDGKVEKSINGNVFIE